MANITTTTAAVMIPEVWANEVLDEVEKNLVLANLFTRWDEDVAAYGDTIHIPNVAGFAAADKSAGTTVTFLANTETEKTITINKHKVVPILIEDIVKAQSKYNLMQRYSKRAGYSIAKAVDTDLAGLHSSMSQNQNCGAAVDDSDIISAIEFLDVADAPRDDRAFVIHGEALADVRALDKFTRYDATGQKGVAVGGNNGLIANAYGVDVYLSNNVEIEDLATDLIHNLMFHKEYAGLAMQLKPKVETEYSVDHLGTKMAVHTIYGFAELRDTFGVDVTLET